MPAAETGNKDGTTKLEVEMVSWGYKWPTFSLIIRFWSLKKTVGLKVQIKRWDKMLI